MPSASQPSLTFLAKSSCAHFSFDNGTDGLEPTKCALHGFPNRGAGSILPAHVSLRVLTFPPHRRYAYLCLVQVVLRYSHSMNSVARSAQLQNARRSIQGQAYASPGLHRDPE